MARSQPFALLIGSDHESPGHLGRLCRWRHRCSILDYWQQVGGYPFARAKAAWSTSFGEEVQHPLILKADLEQYSQYERESANCLNPRAGPPKRCRRQPENAHVGMRKRWRLPQVNIELGALGSDIVKLQALEEELPNGLHDAMLRAISIDFVGQTAELEVDI